MGVIKLPDSFYMIKNLLDKNISESKWLIKIKQHGVPFGGAGAHIFHAKLWYNAALLCTLSVTHFLCDSALILIPSRVICVRCAHFNSQTFASFCTIDHTQSYKFAYSPMASTSYHDRGSSNLLSPDERDHDHAANPTRLKVAASSLCVSAACQPRKPKL